MSIQPNRVIARIIDQVDRSDWPPLEGRIFDSAGGGATLRFFRARASERYATPLHFWVHALRDELAALGRRSDLVGAAGHALCRSQTLSAWRAELEEIELESGGRAPELLALDDLVSKTQAVRVYRMLESECRRSSVVAEGPWLMAHFWGHGPCESWRCKALG